MSEPSYKIYRHFCVFSSRSPRGPLFVRMNCMVCLRCRELASAYHKVLGTYVDLMEFRKAVNGRREALGLLLEARIVDIEDRLSERWYSLSEHRSQHHYYRKRDSARVS